MVLTQTNETSQKTRLWGNKEFGKVNIMPDWGLIHVVREWEEVVYEAFNFSGTKVKRRGVEKGHRNIFAPGARYPILTARVNPDLVGQASDTLETATQELIEQFGMIPTVREGDSVVLDYGNLLITLCTHLRTQELLGYGVRNKWKEGVKSSGMLFLSPLFYREPNLSVTGRKHDLEYCISNVSPNEEIGQKGAELEAFLTDRYGFTPKTASPESRPSVFLLHPFSGLIASDGTIPQEYQARIQMIRGVLDLHGIDMYSALEREEFGKALMGPEELTPLDNRAAKNADLLIAFPDSYGVHVELGWGSQMGKDMILFLHTQKIYTPLDEGLEHIDPMLGNKARVIRVNYTNELELRPKLDLALHQLGY